MVEKKQKHFSSKLSEDGIYRIVFDKDGSSTNTLSKGVLAELEEVLEDVKTANPRAMVFESGKSGGFIAGADVAEFRDIETEEEALALIHFGQRVMNKIEALPFTTVAKINGFCLGGGLELALAFDYRVASDHSKTRIGLPEVLLGIHPGFGGTVRAVEKAGAVDAMQIMLTGRLLLAKQAKQMGLIDLAVPERQLEASTIFLIEHGAKRKKLPLWHKVLAVQFAKELMAEQMRKQVAKKAKRQHYPAPYALINLWLRQGSDRQAAFDAEARSVAALINGDVSSNLVRLFFLQEQLKAVGKDKLESAGKEPRLHVIGGGVMGGDIAAWGALRGMRVTLQDREAKFIAPAIGRAEKLFKKKLKQPRLVEAAMDRLMPDVTGDGVADADVIIEAVFEDLKVKQDIFTELEKKAKAGAVLATNTSSIPLEEIAKAMKDGSRLIGIHFFNPVAMMQLVEVISSDISSEEAIKKGNAFVGYIGKLALPVKSAPGFLVNRVLMPYIQEGVELEQSGINAEAVDRAAMNFGMPMGPLTLADTVGLDICLHVLEVFSEHMDVEIPSRLKELVAGGNLGKKSGSGFYSWNDKKPTPTKNGEGVMLDEEMIDRMMLRMLNEVVAVLREGVVENEELLDAGVIFGTGFAPFRGGPTNYIRQTGGEKLHAKLEELAKKYGKRFTPDSGWSRFL